jgi:hypothetical protein
MAKIFDLETQKSAADVGGWHNKAKMGVSVGCIYDTVKKEYRFYTEHNIPEMCNDLMSSDLVVGYNLIGFDYEVIQPYSVFSLKDNIPTLDLLLEVEKAVGKRLPLDNVAEHSIGINKTADGLEALKWYKEGKISQIAKYCAFDVKATTLVAEFGAAYGCVRYSDKYSGKILEAKVNWKIPWVGEHYPPPAPGKLAVSDLPEIPGGIPKDLQAVGGVISELPVR